MARRDGAVERPNLGTVRLIVVALTLAGFVAMHGLASADTGSSHCAAPDTLISPVARAVHDVTGPGAATTAGAHSGPAVDSVVVSPASTGDDDQGLTTGCLLALLGALVALALRPVRLPAGPPPPTPASSASPCGRAARAPPPSLFLTLCVIRL